MEELIFRGLLQPALVRVVGLVGLPLAAALAGVVHASAGAPLVLVMAGAGLVFGLLVQRTRQLEPAIVGHAGLALGAGVIRPGVLR